MTALAPAMRAFVRVVTKEQQREQVLIAAAKSKETEMKRAAERAKQEADLRARLDAAQGDDDDDDDIDDKDVNRSKHYIKVEPKWK